MVRFHLWRGPPTPSALGVDRQKQAMAALGAPQSKQILFGDLHVHTTFSVDAFVFNLPALQGEGAHPPADACDFARYCSALDFYSINDHAESLTPRKWGEIKQSIRQCNDVAGDPNNPDVVAFTGWEWTNSSPEPISHYGHKNVIFKNTAESDLPARPILAPGGFQNASRTGYFSGIGTSHGSRWRISPIARDTSTWTRQWKKLRAHPFAPRAWMFANCRLSVPRWPRHQEFYSRNSISGGSPPLLFPTATPGVAQALPLWNGTTSWPTIIMTLIVSA